MRMGDFGDVAGQIWASRQIVDDFHALASIGGRFAGTDSETKACEFLMRRLAEATRCAVRRERVPYRGWDRGPAQLQLSDGRRFPACALCLTPPTPPRGLR